MIIGRIAACAIFALAGVIQIFTARGRRSRVLSGFMLLNFAVALTLTIDGPYLGLDRVLGVRNIAELISHVTGLVGIGLLTLLLADVNGRDRRRAWRVEVWCLAGVVCASGILFAAADTPREATRFTATYSGQWTVAGFWTVGATYAVVCLVRLALTVAHSTPDAARADVVHGMRIASIGGGALGFVYVVLKTIELVTRTGHSTHASLVQWEQAALVIGMVCLALGLGVPLFFRASKDLVRQVRIRTALIRLRPLRELMRLHGLVQNSRMPLASNGALMVDLLGGGAHARLLRRVVEIRDGLLAAGLRMPAPSTRIVGKSSGLDVVDEARRLARIETVSLPDQVGATA